MINLNLSQNQYSDFVNLTNNVFFFKTLCK